MDPYSEEDLDPEEVIDGLGLEETVKEAPEREW